MSDQQAMFAMLEAHKPLPYVFGKAVGRAEAMAEHEHGVRGPHHPGAPEGPRCRCGAPSQHESGWCTWCFTRNDVEETVMNARAEARAETLAEVKAALIANCRVWFRRIGDDAEDMTIDLAERLGIDLEADDE